jgi:hypothetical protein
MASSIIIGFLSILVGVMSGPVHRFPPSVVCVGYRTTPDAQIYRGSRLPFFQSFVRAIVATLSIGSRTMSARAQLGFILPRDEQTQISTVLVRRLSSTG